MDQVVPSAPQTIAPLVEHACPLVAVLLAAGKIVLVACALVLVVRVVAGAEADEAATVATAGAVVLVAEVAAAAGTEVLEPVVPDDPDDPLVDELLEDPSPKKSADPVQVYPVPVTPPTTSGPGSGKLTSWLSIVVHPPGPLTLAMKIGGRELNAVSARETIISRAWERLLEEPPSMVTCAQFIYISRLPILLNHVQASKAWPEGASEGTVKL
jgi:hypothetical protein